MTKNNSKNVSVCEKAETTLSLELNALSYGLLFIFIKFQVLFNVNKDQFSSNKASPKIVGWQIEVCEILQYRLR